MLRNKSIVIQCGSENAIRFGQLLIEKQCILSIAFNTLATFRNDRIGKQFLPSRFCTRNKLMELEIFFSPVHGILIVARLYGLSDRSN